MKVKCSHNVHDDISKQSTVQEIGTRKGMPTNVSHEKALSVGAAWSETEILLLQIMKGCYWSFSSIKK